MTSGAIAAQPVQMWWGVVFLLLFAVELLPHIGEVQLNGDKPQLHPKTRTPPHSNSDIAISY